MKYIRFSVWLILLSVVLSGCSVYDMAGHETYTDIADYQKVFELSEIRLDNYRDELFPKTLTDLDVKEFYAEWELSFVGSADFEMLLTVTYTDTAYAQEIERLKTLAGGKIVYNKTYCQYPAYVLAMGYINTSVYALLDEQTNTIHYVHVQLTNKSRIDFDKNLLPKGYYGYGSVYNVDFVVEDPLRS